MPVNSVSGDTTAQAFINSSLFDKSVNSGSRVSENSSEIRGLKQVSVDPVLKNLPVAKEKSPTETDIELRKKPERLMTHVVETYDPNGKLLIKFVDSKNNVLYQIPPEMASKIEGQMTKANTSADISA